MADWKISLRTSLTDLRHQLGVDSGGGELFRFVHVVRRNSIFGNGTAAFLVVSRSVHGFVLGLVGVFCGAVLRWETGAVFSVFVAGVFHSGVWGLFQLLYGGFTQLFQVFFMELSWLDVHGSSRWVSWLFWGEFLSKNGRRLHGLMEEKLVIDDEEEEKMKGIWLLRFPICAFPSLCFASFSDPFLLCFSSFFPLSRFFPLCFCLFPLCVCGGCWYNMCVTDSVRCWIRGQERFITIWA